YSYHSCKNRHCPKCGNDQAQKWLEEQKELLLPKGPSSPGLVQPELCGGLLLPTVMSSNAAPHEFLYVARILICSGIFTPNFTVQKHSAANASLSRHEDVRYLL